MPVLWQAAQRGFGWCGRGALEVDTTAQPVAGQGTPWGYLTLQQIKARGNADEIRMVQHYDPIWEYVIRLRKPKHRVSTYRMVVTAHTMEGEQGR